MDINKIKKIAQLIVKNFSEEKKVFLFGSMARISNTSNDFPSKGKDLDLLFEVNWEIFEEYLQMCQREEFNLLGRPCDPNSMYWSYFSPAEGRWEIIKKIFNINDSLSEEIIDELNGQIIDIIIFPFGWENDKEILACINFSDPKFSKNIQKDRKLLLEE